MPITTYTYQLADFTTSGGVVAQLKWHKEIGDLSLGQTLLYIELDTEAKATFADALSGADETSLDGSVSSHDGVELDPIGTGSEGFVALNDWTTEQATWTKADMFIYAGSKIVDVTGVKITAYMDAGPTSYDFRIVDVTHGDTVIGQALGLVETSPMQWSSVLPLSNLHADPSCWELQFKRNGGTAGEKIHGDGVSFEFA